MAISSIYSGSLDANTANVPSKSATDNLGVNDFLQLMAAQLQNQSMYDETDNSQFLTQLAQFSTLSQINELTSAVKTSSAISLIGKEVAVPDERLSEGYKTGIVSSVGLSSGVPYLQIDGEYYLLSDLLEIGSAEQGTVNTNTNGGV